MSAADDFAAVMRRLRTECPWKSEQTHRSLQRYLLEETYETLEAIDEGEATGDWTHLREELGDLLLQVVFHALIAEDAGEFDLDDVARGVTDKMVRRNTHVFADAADGVELDAAAVNELWQQEKARERQRSGGSDGSGAAGSSGAADVADGLPPALPALLFADKVIDRRERAGDPVTVDGDSDEIGERLLALVAEARAAGVDPEQALRDAVRRH